MANSMQNFSDEQLRRASGGRVEYNSRTKLYDIIDMTMVPSLMVPIMKTLQK